jgi:two-component system, NtrC family, sensor histidine kinase KinB
MSRFFHPSLRTRLFLSLLPLVALFLFMGVCAVTMFSRVAERVNQAAIEDYRSIMAVHSISTLLSDLMQETPSTANSTNTAWAEYTRQLEENLVALAKSKPLAGERELVLQLESQYNDLKKTLEAPPSTGKNQSGLRDSGMVLEISRMRAGLEKIRSLNYQAILDANQDIQKNAHQISRWMTFGLVVVVVISLCSCFWISRSILRPIHALTAATRELGDGDLRELVPVLTHDELGVLAVAFNKMATLLQEYRRSTTAEIVRLHRTMEATLASFPDPVFVLNKEGEITLKNPAALTFSSSLGLENQLPERLRTIARTGLDSGHNFLPHSFDQGLLFRWDGVERFFLPRVLVMQDREGALLGVAIVLQDVTRFRLLDAAKTNLVATVSHELKSPLTSVRMALHLLLEKTLGDLSFKQEQLVQAARDDTERLLRILNDLLDIARLEEGGAELRRENIAPVEILQHVREEMTERTAARNIRINCVVDAQLPAVSVDRQRIDLVFTNLVSNAIKYSPANGEITLSAVHSGSDVEFTIADHGAGISEQHQARVFDRFFRVPGQEKTGAGLGLSIAREITVAHGGRIGVKSTLGRGTTFSVVLKPAANGLPDVVGKLK